MTPAQIAIVLQNISSRQEELQFIDKVIKKEQVKSANNAAAIAHLEPSINRAKLTIDAQKEVLADLKATRIKLEGPSNAAGPNWVELSQARDLCEARWARWTVKLPIIRGNLMNRLRRWKNTFLSSANHCRTWNSKSIATVSCKIRQSNILEIRKPTEMSSKKI